MKYMVMECHPGYAVVLDESGSFRKVANMRYEVGQTVSDVTELAISQAVPVKKNRVRWVSSLTAIAACLALLVSFLFFPGTTPYASVYMTINPQVRIDVDRNDMVVGLEGVNEDGKMLIQGYEYQKKDLDLVVDQLVERAIEMDFLHDGDKISLELDADDNEWLVSHSDSIGTQLSDYLADRMTVVIEVTDKNSNDITVPVGDDEDDDDDDDDDFDEDDLDEDDPDEDDPDEDDPDEDDPDEDDPDEDDPDDDPDEDEPDEDDPDEDDSDDDPDDDDGEDDDDDDDDDEA